MPLEMISSVSPPWREAVAGWAEQLTPSRAVATVDGYTRHLVYLAQALPNVDPWEVTPAQLTGWLDAQNWSALTRYKVVLSLRAFYAWGVAQGHVFRSPMVGVATRTKRRPGPPQRTARGRGWREAIEAHLAWLRAGGRGSGTVEQRRYHLLRLAENFGDPWQVTSDDLARWLAREDWAPETRRSARGAARNFYRWAVMTGRTSEDPSAFLPAVIRPRALPRPIEDEALRDALAVSDDRQRLILLLGAFAGLRRMEIASVHYSDVVGAQLIVHGKGARDRIVPLHPELRAELLLEQQRRLDGGHGTGWTGTCEPDGWLFPGPVRDHISANHAGRLAARVLPPGWTLHQLRHRFATRAYAAQRDLRAVQELLGHSKPETTAVYAAIPDGARTAAVAAVGLEWTSHA